MMDNLEELDNKTLRAKCLEHGLPDIPITDTSRKLLIRRLRAAMEGGDAKSVDKQKNRRETMHVPKTKAPSEERSKSPSRRKTVDSTVSVKGISKKSSPAPAQITQRRRSGKVTPNTQIESIVTEPLKTKMKSTIIEEDPDIFILDDEDTRSRPASRQSRASSLSTSPVVTTTYTQNMKEPMIIEENQEEIEEEQPRYMQKSIYSYEARRSHVSPSVGVQREPTFSTSRSSYLSSHPALVSTGPTITSYESTLSSSVNRRHTNVGGSFDYTSPGYKSTYHLTREDSGDDDDVEKEAPYLSDFARKLSRLKAEPVDGGLAALKKEVGRRRDTRYIAQQNESSIGGSIRQLYGALDRKYGLKQKIYITAGIVIMIFVYIFIFN